MKLRKIRKFIPTVSFGILSLVLIAWIVFGEPGFFGHLNTVGFAFCHQIPTRTPLFHGFSCPLCYRCSGLFFGAAGGFLILFRQRFSSRGLADARVLVWILFSFTFYALDGLKTFGRLPALLRWVPDLAVLRYASGICFGSALALFLAPTVREAGAMTVSARSIRRGSVVSFVIFAGMGWILLAARIRFLIPFQLIFSVAAAFVPVVLVSLLFFVLISAADRLLSQGRTCIPVRERLFCGAAMAALLTVGMILIRFHLTGGWVRAIFR